MTEIEHATRPSSQAEPMQEPASGGPLRKAPLQPGLNPLALQQGRQRLLTKMFGTPTETPRLQHYALLEELGRGGMGIVYEAYDRKLDRKVALKLLHAQRDTVEVQRRFDREAQALAKLSHPNVVPIFEIGEHEGTRFLVMEFVVGRTLRQWGSELDEQGDAVHNLEARLEVLIQTGRGLAAAHAAGLVHRDFKPDNVMVGSDGRPRVLDFGLARGVRLKSVDADPTLIEGGAELTSLSRTVTQRGTLMGTPAYMAPEQLNAERIGPKADQFAFCVTAFELLHGRRPFDGRDMQELTQAVCAGQVDVPARVELPTRVHEAILRGLRVDTDARWPDMATLLDELEAGLSTLDRTRTRIRRRGIAAALGLSALATTATMALMPPAEPPLMCEFDRSALMGTWDGERRSALEARFMATGLGFARQSFEVTAEAFDRWSDAWVEAQREACSATRVTGEQSEAALDKRTTCLDRKRRELATSVDVLLEADARELADVSRLLERLPDLGACADLQSLETPFPLPREASQRAKILELEAKLDRGRTSRQLGDPVEARRLSDALVEQLEHLKYPPLELEIRMLAARLVIDGYDYRAGAQAALAIAREAKALGLDDLEASLRVESARALAGGWSEPEMEQSLVDEARATLRRIGRADDPRELDLLEARAALLCQQGEHAAALDIYEGIRQRRGVNTPGLTHKIANELDALGLDARAHAEYADALALAGERYGEDSPWTANIHFNLGLLLLDRGELESALPHLQRAHSVSTTIYGESSVLATKASFALAKLAMVSGAIDEAGAGFDTALRVFEAKLGPTHDLTAQAFTARGVQRYFSGDYRASINDYEHALELQLHNLGPHHEDIGVLYSNMGESHLELGEHDEALVKFDLAMEVLAGTPDHPQLALVYKGRGQTLLALGRVNEATEVLEHALKVLERTQGEPYEIADSQLALAQALLASRSESQQIEGLIRQARATFVDFGEEHRVAEADALLTSHHQPRQLHSNVSLNK